MHQDSALNKTPKLEAAPSPFAALGLAPSFVRALEAEGYVAPTPIQTQAIPALLEGRDLLGCAQTGTGKTAAFLLPVLQRLSSTPRTKAVRALILAPTRELAIQIAERCQAYGKGCGLTHVVVYGGVGQRPQEDALRRNPDIIIATPGRLLDLMQQGFVRLGKVECFVLDEADRMLDMGFIHDVKRVIRELPPVRQTLLFSATLPTGVRSLVQSLLRDPVTVTVRPNVTTAEAITQSVYFVDKNDKRTLLLQLLRDLGVPRSLVFTRTKHGANRVAEQLAKSGINAAAIHGNKSQGARERALEGFRKGTIPVLVATDIAARGIDVDDVTHVFNFDLPNVAESYVHRIGRTGRAERSGTAISFCDSEERAFLADIERFIRQRVPVAEGSMAPPVSAHHTTVDAPRKVAAPGEALPRSNRTMSFRPRRRR
jgi:ATP-dependent RNA helicase RhlE